MNKMFAYETTHESELPTRVCFFSDRVTRVRETTHESNVRFSFLVSETHPLFSCGCSKLDMDT